MKEISKDNAKILGKDNLLWQTQEECGELIKAIGKYNRARGVGQKTETTLEEALDNLIEEVADVEICIEQLKYIMNIEGEVEERKDVAFEKVKKRYEGNEVIWHPYPNEKPKSDDSYLVTLDNGSVWIYVYDNGMFFEGPYCCDDSSVIAWAELPRAYEVKE